VPGVARGSKKCVWSRPLIRREKRRGEDGRKNCLLQGGLCGTGLRPRKLTMGNAKKKIVVAKPWTKNTRGVRKGTVQECGAFRGGFGGPGGVTGEQKLCGRQYKNIGRRSPVALAAVKKGQFEKSQIPPR